MINLAKRMTTGYVADVFFMRQFITKQNPVLFDAVKKVLNIT
jgi:hypothetical protein